MIAREHRAVFSDQLRQRRRGRPRSVAPMVPVSARIPESDFDAVCRLALEQRQPVPELLRQAIASYVRSSRV